MLSRREAEARAAFILILGTGESLFPRPPAYPAQRPEPGRAQYSSGSSACTRRWRSLGHLAPRERPAPHNENLDAEGSPETDMDKLSADEELLKLKTKSRQPACEYDGYERPYDEYQPRGLPGEDYALEDY
ncbi:hypothetical protein FRC08_015594 [Ceratobasidium sp. 394]|nr:hypothetical protein FRC08_015594 [Ceratobasidium sp. 394]